jgi:hypothetical protein
MNSSTPSSDSIMRLGFAYWGSKAFLSAVELGLFTELGKGPLDAETLRQRLGLHKRSALDFFDTLVVRHTQKIHALDSCLPPLARWREPKASRDAAPYV